MNCLPFVRFGVLRVDFGVLCRSVFKVGTVEVVVSDFLMRVFFCTAPVLYCFVYPNLFVSVAAVIDIFVQRLCKLVAVGFRYFAIVTILVWRCGLCNRYLYIMKFHSEDLWLHSNAALVVYTHLFW